MTDFKAIKLKIVSPEDILAWSHGEVIKAETINYRTQRPEKDGLFSERIFGPTKDWECYCGKYRRTRYKGVICDRCGVEVTRSAVRRERMGHIALAVPVIHLWFLRSVPSKIGLLFDAPIQKLEKVVYYITYVVTAVNDVNRERSLNELENEFKSRLKIAKGDEAASLKEARLETRDELQNLKVGQVLGETEYYNLSRRFGDVFEAGTGGEAIRKILAGIDLRKFLTETKKQLAAVADPTKKIKLLRRLKLLNAMVKNQLRPEWMVLTTLPVLPPDLRPMVALDGGRYATSDLNDLYRRVINRNNRLKKLMELKAPAIITVNEKRMLQEAVDALIDNSSRLGSQQLSSRRRPLRSLADMLKGKAGRFRQNLLGKRVDYSGRSVIVIGPELKLHQAGLPKKMALEIFKPFVLSKIISRGLAHNIRNANRLVEQGLPVVWEILEEVISNRYVLLNRAPTLHRLGIQAFQPLLIEDLAIRIPPLVTQAFNADFDGDQMAVHLPLTEEAQKEAQEIMLSSVNLLKPATGEPIAEPTQDIILGCYYLTTVKPGGLGADRLFVSKEEAYLAYEAGIIDLRSLIKVGSPREQLRTTVGRLFFNDVLPPGFEFVNNVLDKKTLRKAVAEIINRVGIASASHYLNEIVKLGFNFATLSGITWGIDDLITPVEKDQMIAAAEKEEALVRSQFEQGLLTSGERRARIISIWDEVKIEMAKLVPKVLDPENSVYSIIDSGARGSWSQPTQMMGMKGLVQNPQGETIELPIKSSLKEGFSVLEYFISTHGARKGSTDTALKTAHAGFLARRLVDVAQELTVREEDCRTKEGIEMHRQDGAEFGQTFSSRLFSRVLLDDLESQGSPRLTLRAGEIINKETAELIEKDTAIAAIKVRSPITCKTIYGICGRCYGYDLGRNQPVAVGEAVGVIAAQSISEPGTQLTMRTFHTGGIAGVDITHGLPRVEELFEARPPKGKAFLAEEDGQLEEIEERGLLKVIKIRSAAGGKKPKIMEYPVPRTSEIYFQPGDQIKAGDQLSEGHLDLKEILALRGGRAVERYVVNEVQRIYISEGASINNKHIEIIVRQMFSRVRIKEVGASEFVLGEVVEKSKFLEANRQLKTKGREPAKGLQLLLGITRVALSAGGFLSAASFMETQRVLVNAAVEGRVDQLRGLKENVIIGRLIPVKTGLKTVLPKSGEDAILEE